MRRGVWCGVIWVCVMMWGCDEKKGSEITPDASGDKKEVVTASQGQEPEKHTDEKQSEEEEESLSDVPEIDSARVKATVEAWAKSQNEGNFEDYKGLYAERFTGVKRVGPKVSQFDRKGWLKDRERMFKKKVTVTLEDMNVHTVSNSAVVRVTQTWASGTFKDTGPKQLVLVPEGDGGC